MTARVLTEQRPSVTLTGFIEALFRYIDRTIQMLRSNVMGENENMSCFFDRALIGSLVRTKEPKELNGISARPIRASRGIGGALRQLPNENPPLRSNTT